MYRYDRVDTQSLRLLQLFLGLGLLPPLHNQVVLDLAVDDRQHEVPDHAPQEQVPQTTHEGLARLECLGLEQLLLLPLQSVDKFVLEEGKKLLDELKELLNMSLAEQEDDEEHLDVDFDDCLADEGCQEEGPEGDLEAPTEDPSQVE